jgi:hypothetical protein
VADFSIESRLNGDEIVLDLNEYDDDDDFDDDDDDDFDDEDEDDDDDEDDFDFGDEPAFLNLPAERG